MKAATGICIFLFMLGAALFLLQLWLPIWSAETFTKILITNAALFGISLVVAFLIREHKDSRRIEKGDGLD